MGVRLGIVGAAERSGAALAAGSCAALDRALATPAELTVSIATGDTLWLGAFQRAADLPDGPWSVHQRGSGGPEVRAAGGAVHVLLALASPSALMPCDEKRIVNRYVRPLLRALGKCGHLAHYFGRDWISVDGAPVAWVGFGHDATTGRTVFEAVVAVSAPFAVRERESLRGKRPGQVAVDPLRLARAIQETYVRDAERVELSDPAWLPQAPAAGEPPWSATREEAIGTVGAWVDDARKVRVGGDLLVSRDALSRLEQGASRPDVDVGALVDATLRAPGVALDGVRSLTSVRDVVVEALAASRARAR